MELELIHEFSTRDRRLSFLGFSPDDQKLVSYGGSYSFDMRQVGTLRLRDVESGRDLHKFDKCIGTARFTSDGHYVISLQETKKGFFGKRLSFVWWNVETGAELNRQELLDDALDNFEAGGFAYHNAVTYTKTSSLAYCVGANRALAVLDVKAGLIKASCGPPTSREYKSAHAGEHPWHYAAVAVASNGKMVLWGDEDRFYVRLLSAKGEWLKFPKQHKGWVNAAAFSPDCRHALTGAQDGVLYWDLQHQKPIGKVMQTSEGILDVVLSDHCPKCIAFTPGGNEALFGHSRGARLFDLRRQSSVSDVPLRKSVVCAAFSHDGSKLAIGTENGKVSLWEIPMPDTASSSHVEQSTQQRTKGGGNTKAQRPVHKGDSGAQRVGEFYCPRCREQNTALDENGFRCGNCGAQGDIETIVKLGATFNFRTGERY